MAQTKISARQKLQLSRLHLNQQELMGHDIDVEMLKFQIKKVFSVNIAEALTDASVERTVEGASTVVLHVLDRDRRLLRSGQLTARTDIKLDGLWFRLVAVNKNDDDLQLTFEDREIAVLRTYATHLKAHGTKIAGIDIGSRQNITRAQFILRLINEVKEFKIPWVIPELEKIQPIEAKGQDGQPLGGNSFNKLARGKGIPHGAGKDIPRDTRTMHQYAPPGQVGLRVKKENMTDGQIDVANAVLNTGASMGCTTAELIMGIMCAIDESTLHNYRGGDLDSVGVFQQRKSQGWPATRNIPTDAHAFFSALKTEVARHPHWTYNDLIQGVQNSGTPYAYAQYFPEAKKIVEAWGGASNFGSSNAQGQFQGGQQPYHFYRGVPPSQGTQKWGRENSWHCIQRLADEVNFRAFFVSGTFYYISEEALFQSQPAAIITEGAKGVEAINGEYDIGKKSSQLDLTVRMGRWSAPPGSVILIRGMGPFNGRWLVNDVSRGLFDSQGTITIKKPRPILPEPIGSTADQNAAGGGSDWSFNTGSPTSVPQSDRMQAAKNVLSFHKLGYFRDDSGHSVDQLKRTAQGLPVRNQCGHDVYLSARMLNALVYLMDNGMWVGTFAICTDHHCNDGQHPKGQACDISSLGGGQQIRRGGPAGAGGVKSPRLPWTSLNHYSKNGTILAKEAMQMLHDSGLAWDLICNGVGREDATVQALQMDNGRIRGGHWWTDHTDHIHFGATTGGRN